MQKLSNIHVSLSDTASRNAAAGWEMDGARFHVWFDLKTMEIEGGYPRRDTPVIYKNPLVTDRNDPAFFDTRKLNANSKANAEILKVVFAEIADKKLIDAAFKAAEKREQERQAESREAMRQESVRQAAPKLVAELKELRAIVFAYQDGLARNILDMPRFKQSAALLRELGEAE